MQVKIKQIDIPIELKNNGVELEIRDGKNKLEDLVIGKGGITWCKGKTSLKNGVKKSWGEVLTFFNNDDKD